MVDRTLLAKSIADIRDAVRRIREVLPQSAAEFGRDRTIREVVSLADRKVLDASLAERLGKAAGLLDLIAHRYATLDWNRIHAIAAGDLDDLLSFCEQLVRSAHPPQA